MATKKNDGDQPFIYKDAKDAVRYFKEMYQLATANNSPMAASTNDAHEELVDVDDGDVRLVLAVLLSMNLWEEHVIQNAAIKMLKDENAKLRAQLQMN